MEHLIPSQITTKQKVIAGSALAGLVVFLMPFLYLGTPTFRMIMGGFTIGAVLIAVVPILTFVYLRHHTIITLEDSFPNLLRDLSESQKAGMTLPLALQQATRVDYGALTKEVKVMSNQISWGVPFNEVLRRFSARSGSSFISRAVVIILEAAESGGDITDILESVAEDSRIIKESEQQRELSMSEYMATVYTIFFIFLGVLVALNKILTPLASIPAVSGFGISTAGGAYVFSASFKILFFHLTMIQGFLNGLLAGEIGKGSLIAGLKHSLLFMAVGFIVFLIVVYDFHIFCMFAPTMDSFIAMGCGL